MDGSSTEDFPNSQIAVIGAAGKMGSGISLILWQELARCKIPQRSKQPEYTLTLIDNSHTALNGLKKYLQRQMLKWAEKNILFLREAVSRNNLLISNKEVIDHFMASSMDILHFSCSLEEAKYAELIFEAVSEDIDIKVGLLSTLQKQSTKQPYFFSNTSSIPISLLNERAQLGGRIIGFHFYNPPAVQKLVEIIPLNDGNSELLQLAETIAHKLDKEIIYAKDVAGFIGNGYFLREIMFACTLTEQLKEKFSVAQSIYLINKVTQDFLLRPMGIFQLIDYVGLDVVVKIGTIMNQYLQLPINFTQLFQPLFDAGNCGGQYPDGSQKKGFFLYADNQVSCLFSEEMGSYIALDKMDWKAPSDGLLGSPPDNLTWKTLNKAPNRELLIKNYFEKLSEEKTLGAKLAMKFLQNLQKITVDLVKDGVAKRAEDVDTVLKRGFFHPYGIHAIFKDHSWELLEKNSM